MVLTTKIYKTYLKQVISKYPVLDFTKPVKLPLVEPYNASNGQYVAYPQNAAGTNLGVGFPFEATSFALTSTSSTMLITPTTFHWNTISAGLTKIAIKQILPNSVEIDCIIISLGATYSPDGSLDVDLTNNGFISFNSGTFIT